MPEATEFSFNLDEVLRILIREQGLEEGKWAIGFNLSMTAGNFGLGPENSQPGALIQIRSINLSRADEATEGTAHIVDAAKVLASTKKSKRGGTR